MAIPSSLNTVAIDATFDGSYEFLVVPTDIVYTLTVPQYTRWIGKIKGGLIGGSSEIGVTLWEQFNFE